ncbi:M4 family metallopeptidase [Streptomyces sp. NPDC002851]
MLVAAVASGSALAGGGGGADHNAPSAADRSHAATAKSLGLGDKEKLVPRSVIKDADGTVHTRYDRTYDGLRVIGGDLIVHKPAGGKQSVTKAQERDIAVASTRARSVPADAQKAAVKVAEDEKIRGAKAEKPTRVVWAAGDGKPVLAYETVVDGKRADGTPSRLHVFTDAASGKRLATSDAVKSGTGESGYSGEVELDTTKGDKGFELKDPKRGGGWVSDLKQAEDDASEGELFTDDDDKWGGDRQTAAVDAAYGAANAWDYYKSVHKRDGIRDDGKGALSRVHYGDGVANAFWNDEAFAMTYGDGEGNKKPVTSLDVAAHEMSHGVTSATANLNYEGESGGLNEATSDIFGTDAEFFAKNDEDKGDYLIGEKVDLLGDGKPLRYMDEPSKDGKSLDYWSEDAGNVDVHHSSGIANHFFYLLSEGSGKKEINGVKYDSPTKDGSKVKGIGRDKAVQIWYRALTTYMTSTTDYKAAREATLKAADDLYGADSTESKTVAAAWTAVNVK